ncbi:hypothetical protein LINPERPRIM_LOCUS34174 [Linum perenne]
MAFYITLCPSSTPHPLSKPASCPRGGDVCGKMPLPSISREVALIPSRVS